MSKMRIKPPHTLPDDNMSYKPLPRVYNPGQFFSGDAPVPLLNSKVCNRSIRVTARALAPYCAAEEKGSGPAGDGRIHGERQLLFIERRSRMQVVLQSPVPSSHLQKLRRCPNCCRPQVDNKRQQARSRSAHSSELDFLVLSVSGYTIIVSVTNPP